MARSKTYYDLSFLTISINIHPSLYKFTTRNFSTRSCHDFQIKNQHAQLRDSIGSQKLVGLFFLPPTSHELQYISVTSAFTKLNMKTKYVCRGLISLYVSFHNNRTMWSTNLHVKICRWGGGGRKKSHW